MCFGNHGCLGVCDGVGYKEEAQMLRGWVALARGMIDRKLMLQRAWREDSRGLTVTVVSH